MRCARDTPLPSGALLLATGLVAAAPALATLELNGNALSDDALEKLGELLPDGVLGEMDDNDEDLADDDELDEAGDDGGLGDLLSGLGARAGSFQIRPIHPFGDAPAKRVLVRAVRGGKAPLRLLPALILHDREAEAKHTAEVEAILRGRADLAWL